MSRQLKSIGRDASIHPRTVTDMSKGKVATPRKRRAPVQHKKIQHTKVDLRVWKHALKLAGRETSRIQVISPTEVIVHNPGRKFK